MQSCVIEQPTDTLLDLQCLPTHVLLDETYFATSPMLVAQPAVAQARANEEELHHLFEEAISDRVKCISLKLNRLSGNDSLCTQCHIHAPEPLTTQIVFRKVRSWRIDWRPIRLLCLSFSLLLLGFDLMGLLVMLR